MSDSAENMENDADMVVDRPVDSEPVAPPVLPLTEVDVDMNESVSTPPVVFASNTVDSDPPKMKYISHKINGTPSVATFFAPGSIRNPPPRPIVVKKEKSCIHLSGVKYIEYIARTETRSMGGVSPSLRARIMRQILLYKKFGPLKAAVRTVEFEGSIPTDGNDRLPSPEWTPSEHRKVDDALGGFARWMVDFGKQTVRSARCGGLTTNHDEICDACAKIAKDQSLIHSMNLKNREAALPLDEQHQIEMDRAKYSSHRFHDLEGRNLELLLQDPVTFKALKALEKGESTECFLQLYEATLNGKLKDYETIKEMCTVVAEVIKRKDANTMSGIRYPAHFLNFAILMRSYGGNSARQALVPKSADALRNPYLIFENMARVKRLVDSIHYSGPVAVAGDCTKVRKRLSFSNDFGGHILGSVWELENCIAEDPDDIERVINEITKANAEATQVRAILIKVPLPHIHPQVVALLPTNGTDDAAKIFEQHLKLLAMAAELSLPVVSFSADGAASELAAQRMMDDHESPFPPITYDYPLHGIHLKAPVLQTGPVISGQDPGHAKKTARNGVQSGSRTEDLGVEVVVNTAVCGVLIYHESSDQREEVIYQRLWLRRALIYQCASLNPHPPVSPPTARAPARSVEGPCTSASPRSKLGCFVITINAINRLQACAPSFRSLPSAPGAPARAIRLLEH
ncbi:hypothetical protein C8R45DRAFT_1095403 [Mycena sanguinolenta]|nr:hypothetical protein C8R45DRAFT_1095403 [Mycena sanguinolenta]